MPETILLGAAALLSTIFGLDALRNKRPFFCSLLCVSSVVLLAFCAYNWHRTLTERGEDPFLLGVRVYPFVPAGMAALLLTTLILLTFGVIRAVQTFKNKNTSDT